MFSKKSLCVLLVLFSIIGFAKELNEDRVFVKGGLELEKNTLERLSIKYKPYFSEVLDQIYENSMKQYKEKAKKNKNPKKEIEFKKSDFIKIINKLKNFYAMSFWVTTKGKVKLELKGISIINLIESLPKGVDGSEIKSLNDFKYLSLSGDNIKNYIYLASKKDITVITMGVKLDNIFTYKAPKNTKNLEETLALSNKVKYEFYLALGADSFLTKLKQNPILKNFKGFIFKSSFNKSKEWNNTQLIAFLGDTDYLTLSNKLNLMYKQILPKLLLKLEEFKSSSMKEKSSFSKLNQEYIFNTVKTSLEELKISNKDKYLEISLKTKGIDNDSSQIINLSMLGIIPAIAVPAYQGYIKRSKEHEEMKKLKENKIKSK